jgi:hypothetical protein
MIAFDFAGSSRCRPKKSTERVIQRLAGETWVDEQSEEIVRHEAHFAQAAKVGGGLLGSLGKGSNLIFGQKRINDEARLPSCVKIHFPERIAFVRLRGHTIDRCSDYKKFPRQRISTLRARTEDRWRCARAPQPFVVIDSAPLAHQIEVVRERFLVEEFADIRIGRDAILETRVRFPSRGWL